MHELAANALKYGALSTRDGRILVRGRIDNKRLNFVWEERGGPAAREPLRTGFGDEILNDMAREFCEEVRLAYAETGFTYALECELSRIAHVVDIGALRTADAM